MTQRYDANGEPMTAAQAAAWDAEVDARFAAVRAEQEAAEQPPAPARSADEIRRMARQIKGYEADSATEHIRDIAKRIRGPF